MDRPRFSGINFTFKALCFKKSLKLIKLLDFDHADISLDADPDGKHLCTFKELKQPYENGRRLLEQMDAEGLSQTDLFVFIGDIQKTALNHPDATVREFSSDMFRRAVEYATACECKHITILPGAEFHDDFNASLTRASRELEWRVDYAAKNDITLSIEAHIGSIVDMPDKAAELVNMTKGLTLTLDYSHFIKNGAGQPDIDALLPYAAHMHFRNAAKGKSQTIFDESEIDYLRVICLLKERSYNGGLTIEFCSQAWENQNRVDTVGETVFLRDYLLNNWEAV